MTKLLCKTFLTGMIASVLFVAATDVRAQEANDAQIMNALNQKNLSEVEGMMKGSTSVDAVVRALLKHTQEVMAKDPDFSGKMVSLAGQYASQITPPSVPVICADLRRIVDGIPEGQSTSSFAATVTTASEQFSKAPVVVSAGRPNQCETAFLRIATLRGEDPLLIQLPGMSGPGLPPTTIRPGIPPSTPSTEDKPSAD